MSAPVDLANFREVTGGDQELESELFHEFIETSSELIDLLGAHIQGLSDNESWRKNAHALKGIAGNLGAEQLSIFAKEAQESAEKSIMIKNGLLKNITQEHNRVIGYLKNGF